MQKPAYIIIEVHGGLASVTECPDGITYEIRDYDVEGLGVDDTELETDENGDLYYCR